MQPKFVAQKMLLKQKPSKHFRKWIASVLLLFRAFTRWKRVYCSQYCMELPTDSNSICTAHYTCPAVFA